MSKEIEGESEGDTPGKAVTLVEVWHTVEFAAVTQEGMSEVMVDPGNVVVIREYDVDLDVDMLVDAAVRVAEERQIVEAMN